MKPIALTENALIIRTDFSDPASWETLVAAVHHPDDSFISDTECDIEFLDDRDYAGATAKQLLAALPEDYPHTFLVIADKTALAEEDHPLLIVDLLEDRGRQFRALADQIASIDSNLAIGNMGFEEFAEAVDDTGIFRGFPEM